MSYLERYLQEVGRNLNKRQREDVCMELRGLLEDACEERGGDEAAALTVLTEMGPPHKVAERYQQPRFLIGPSLYPAFIHSLWLLLILALSINTMVWLLFEQRTDIMAEGLYVQAFIKGMVQTLGRSWSHWLHFTALAMFVFAIAERSNQPRQKEWQPSQLPPLQEKIVNRLSEAFGAASILGALLIIHVFPRAMTVFSGGDQGVSALPFVIVGLENQLWLFNIWAVCALCLSVGLLYRGYWSRPFTVLSWFARATGILLLLVIIREPNALQFNYALIDDPNTSLISEMKRPLYYLGQAMRAGLLIPLGITVYEMILECLKQYRTLSPGN